MHHLKGQPVGPQETVTVPLETLPRRLNATLLSLPQDCTIALYNTRLSLSTTNRLF